MNATYRVHARRWRHGWELHINGVGVTQCRRLGEAKDMVRDYLALETNEAPESFTIIIEPELGNGLDGELAAVRQEAQEVAVAQRRAAERSRRLARRLIAGGLTGKEVAMVLGVSPQRVSQLLKDPRTPQPQTSSAA